MFPKVRQLVRKRTRKQIQIGLAPVRSKAAAQSLGEIKEVGNVVRARLALVWVEPSGPSDRASVLREGTVSDPGARSWQPLAFSSLPQTCYSSAVWVFQVFLKALLVA